MPATTLDPKTALITIDLQKGILALPTAHPAADIVRHASMLADAFRRRSLPVVLVTVDARPPGRTEQAHRFAQPPAGWSDLIPGLDRQPDDHVVTKRSWGAFASTDLEAFLRERGVTQLVIAGVATSDGVESTARHAYDLGFHVTIASDATTDIDAEAHQHSLARVLPKLGETATTGELIALLGKAVA